MPAGRPTKYKEEYAEQVYRLCLLGMTDAELAKYFEVAESTVNEWKLQYPDFSESIKRGKAEADSMVAEKLFKKATGYSHPEDKIFLHEGEPVIVPTTKHYAPDTIAGIFWLKNRKSDAWKDKQEISLDADVHTEGSAAEILAATKALMDEIARRK
jgi:hypothetical protein